MDRYLYAPDLPLGAVCWPIFDAVPDSRERPLWARRM